ncbi:hypothetical protein [Hyphobacterium sp.]|uniref:hypothetical protein n=1 Tax=Hyphobacterium sp. TaxID=2004662 RepID=UPI003BAC933B
MRGLICGIWLLAIASAGAQQETPPNLGQEMLAFVQAANAHDAETALEIGREIPDIPAFQSLPVMPRMEFYNRLAWLEAATGNAEAALLLLDTIEAESPDPGLALSVRYDIMLMLDRWTEASDAMQRLLAINRFYASYFYPPSFDRLLGRLSRQGEHEEIIALTTAAEGLFVHEAPEWTDAGRRFLLAISFTRLGLEDRAAAQLSGMRIPSLLAEIRYDRTFSYLWNGPGFDEWTDVRAATQLELTRLQALAEENPHHLSIINSQIRALDALGNEDEALQLAEATLERIGAGRRYRDQEQELDWLLQELADLYYADARFEDGDAMMERAINRPRTESQFNINQSINYAIELLSRGEDARVLAFVESLPGHEMSSFGELFTVAVRACLAHYDGERDEYRRYLTELEEGAEINPGALENALHCAGDEDRLASIMLEKLNDPDRRQGVLALAQEYSATGDFAAPPEVESERARERRERLERLLARPEIAALIDQYARRVNFHVDRLIDTGG